jgi:hypothetical protein
MRSTRSDEALRGWSDVALPLGTGANGVADVGAGQGEDDERISWTGRVSLADLLADPAAPCQ